MQDTTLAVAVLVVVRAPMIVVIGVAGDVGVVDVATLVANRRRPRAV